MTPYHTHPYVSNSSLSELKKQLSAKDQHNPQANYDFGSLVHAMLLEPNLLDHIHLTLEGVQYTREQWKLARAMRDAALANGYVKTFLPLCEKEVPIFRDSVEFTVDGITFTLNCRMKADLLHRAGRMVADFKTFTGKTRADLINAIHTFDWDRAAAWYLDTADCDKFLILGIGKAEPHPIIPFPIQRGGELYERGRQKYLDLALKYWMLK